jgi:REP element-mobilizing transposase RayT
MTPLETYLRELRDIRSSGAAVKETSYYPALSNLLNEIGKRLKPRVRCIINLSNRGAGIPDGGLFTAEQFQKPSEAEPLPGQPPARGVIEVKSTKEDAWVTADGEQVSRYWGKYRQVLVTNYRDFVLVGQDAEGKFAKLESFHLAESEKAFWAAAVHPRSLSEKIGARFEEYLLRVMRHAAQLAAPEDVAWFLASYARDAKSRIEGVELAALATVRTALEEALGLKFEGEKGEHFFRSSLVQTLFYGVFSAWVLWSKQRSSRSAGFQPAPEQSRKDAGATIPGRQDAGVTARFDWRTAAWYLRVPMISKLFQLVADPQELDALKVTEVLGWAETVLNRVDRRSFFDKFQESHAVQYFYEPFLEAFDPELRKELGVWYTPPEIVKYMVERVDTVLREELNLSHGLADKNVYVLDPCCGTGSYLVEVLDRIYRTLKERGEDALTASDLKEAAQKRVFGFEILPAPFVVSHLQLGLFLQNIGAPLSEKPRERVGVYLTNALTGWEPPKGPKQRLIFPELEEERDAAERVKLDVPILVILGNPPYNSFAGIAKMEEERDLSEGYRTTRQAPAPQGQGLNDLYVRFFRMAERRIVEKTGRGVVCLISNYSWLDGLSFTGMRERYLEAFDRIWIDCLNGDKYKTGKLTPEGEPDPSVFSTEFNREGIQVGTAIALLVRNAGFQPAQGSRQDAGATDRGATARQDGGVTPVPFRYESVATRGRGYLPHWEMEGATYSVTFRLGDSLPQALRAQIDFERKDILKTAQQQGRDLTEAEDVRLADLHRRFDEALDAGYGACYLARPEVAEPVYNALRYFDGERYKLVAACVMPNHVHAVFAPSHGYGLENILHSWKSFTSKEANKLLGRTGQLWEREYFDRLVRDAEELERAVRYVIENPAKAGLENWNWVWIHDAFRDTLRSAAVPDRTAGFQPAQERSRQDAGATEAPVVRFRHLWGKTKRQLLLHSVAQDGKSLYEEIAPSLELRLSFMPAEVNSGYFSWAFLPHLFPSFFPGVQTKRDDLVIDFDRERLIGRMRQYFDANISHEQMKEICPRAMESNAQFNAKLTRERLLKRGFLPAYVVRYCYRPFDWRWLYWEPQEGLLGRKSPDYFPQVFEGNVWIEARQKQPMEHFDRGYVVRILADNFGNGFSDFFPLYSKHDPEQTSLGDPKASIVPNLSDGASAYLRALGAAAPEIFYHAIAVLHDPAYRTENSGALRQDWPRIPLPDSKEALLASAELGQQIAALLDTETQFVAPASCRQASGTLALQRIATFTLPHGTTLDEAKHFAVTAGWGHAGQGGVTMPGKGKIIERDYSAAERNAGFQPAPGSRQDAGAAAQQDAGATLGDRTCDVYLNEVAYWSNIPLRVWEYTIGGYQVMKKWLSYREEKLLGRPLTKEEVRYVQEMARRIAGILLLEPALDANYQNVKAHTFPWKG